MTNITQIIPTAITDDIFKELTKKALWTTIGNDVNPLNQWILHVEDYTRTTKQKGDLFEILCPSDHLLCKCANIISNTGR